MKSTSFLRTLATATLLATAALPFTACSTGDNPGEVNKEGDGAKDMGPDEQPIVENESDESNQANSGLGNSSAVPQAAAADTAQRPTVREQYENAGGARDVNTSGKQD